MLTIQAQRFAASCLKGRSGPRFVCPGSRVRSVNKVAGRCALTFSQDSAMGWKPCRRFAPRPFTLQTIEPSRKSKTTMQICATSQRTRGERAFPRRTILLTRLPTRLPTPHTAAGSWRSHRRPLTDSRNTIGDHYCHTLPFTRSMGSRGQVCECLTRTTD